LGKSLNSSRKDAHPHAYGVLALADWNRKESGRQGNAAGEALAPRTMLPVSLKIREPLGWYGSMGVSS
jgi:hypothetical protein